MKMAPLSSAREGPRGRRRTQRAGMKAWIRDAAARPLLEAARVMRWATARTAGLSPAGRP